MNRLKINLETDFEPHCYTLDRTLSSKQFLFSHNGLFNLWNKFLLFHWNDDYFLLMAPPDMTESFFSKKNVKPIKNITESAHIFVKHYIDVLEKCVIEMIENNQGYIGRHFSMECVRLFKSMLM